MVGFRIHCGVDLFVAPVGSSDLYILEKSLSLSDDNGYLELAFGS